MPEVRLKELAATVGGTLLGDEDPAITGAAGLEHAGPGDITFVTKKALLTDLEACRAAAVILGPDMESDLPAIRVAEPYAAFAVVLDLFAPDPARVFPPGVHATAVIDPSAEVQATAVGPGCVIGAGVTVGAGCVLGPLVVIEADASVGEDCVFHARSTVRERCRIGARVVLHPGSVIGADGFGYLPGPEGLQKIPQIGIVVLEDDVEIGANVCIDRATSGRTVVGRGTKIDNLVQIAHNVVLGEHCALSSQTGISGSCQIGDRVTMGGQVGLADHVEVGDNVMIAAKSGVYKNVEAGQKIFGYPAVERAEAWRIVVAQRRLPALLRTVSELERKLARLLDAKDV